MKQTFLLELLLVHSSGPIGEALNPDLIIRIQAVCLSRLSTDCLAIDRSDYRQDRVHRFALQAAEVEALGELVRRTGLPERQPLIDGVIDTSDGQANLFLRAKLNDKVGEIEVDMLSSGFDGADASAVRMLITRVIELAGLKPSRAWSTLTGLWHDEPPT